MDPLTFVAGFEFLADAVGALGQDHPYCRYAALTNSGDLNKLLQDVAQVVKVRLDSLNLKQHVSVSTRVMGNVNIPLDDAEMNCSHWIIKGEGTAEETRPMDRSSV